MRSCNDNVHPNPDPTQPARRSASACCGRTGRAGAATGSSSRVEYEPDMNCISVLQKIAEQAGHGRRPPVPPVAWECNCLEEVCGACTMLVNGRVRQACTALVDRLLAERPGGIELRPMTKFPVLRDLMVDRSRMFASLEKIRPGCRSTATWTWAPGRGSRKSSSRWPTCTASA